MCAMEHSHRHSGVNHTITIQSHALMHADAHNTLHSHTQTHVRTRMHTYTCASTHTRAPARKRIQHESLTFLLSIAERGTITTSPDPRAQRVFRTRELFVPDQHGYARYTAGTLERVTRECEGPGDFRATGFLDEVPCETRTVAYVCDVFIDRCAGVDHFSDIKVCFALDSTLQKCMALGFVRVDVSVSIVLYRSLVFPSSLNTRSKTLSALSCLHVQYTRTCNIEGYE